MSEKSEKPEKPERTREENAIGLNPRASYMLCLSVAVLL